MVTEAQWRAYNKAMDQIHRNRTIRGKVYKYYGGGYWKFKLRERALRFYEKVHIVKMPAIIRQVNPTGMNFIAYVRERKKKQRR